MTTIIVNIDVPDLARGIDFYSRAFALTPGRRIGEDAQEMLGAQAPLWLLVKADGSTGAPGAQRTYVRHWTPVHLDVVVDDLDTALARAMAAGATLERPPQDHAWGRIAMLADPFGNGFCLIAFTGRGYDEIADVPAGQGP